jgi:hypothetical protein
MFLRNVTRRLKLENDQTSQHLLPEEYLKELLAKLSDPIHKRVIRAYRGDVDSMENELGKILMEILRRED